MKSTIQIKKKRGLKSEMGNSYYNETKTGTNSLGEQWGKIQAQQQQYSLINIDDFDLAQYIEQQIVHMEESPARSQLEDLKLKNLKFKDDRFPPNLNSLTGQWKTIPDWSDIEWGRISAALPKARIFNSRPRANHIIQGTLGDCYFLAGLAAICERPDRIFNLFLTQEQNQQRYFSVKLLYKGKWMRIDMDEFIPVYANPDKSLDPAFSKAIDNSLWVILLEKAWAKLYTSYRRIEAGFPQQALHDLTGAPTQTINLSASNLNRSNLWKQLLNATKLQYAMVCSSKPGSDTQTSQTGVVKGHAYTLLSALELNFKGRIYRLIKLRNPWGQVEYNGQWSDDDPIWNQVHPIDKERIGFRYDKKDGVFFIGYERFCQEFRSITIGQINDDASYIYKSAKDPQSQGCYFRIQIKVEGLYSLMIDKTPQRSFENSKQRLYQYPNATIEVGILGNNKVYKQQKYQNNLRTTSLKMKMSPGKYIVKALVKFNQRLQTQFEVNLAVYAQYPCSIQLASNKQATLMEGMQVKWKGNQPKEPTIWNRQSAWEQPKQPKKEQKLQDILDFNGYWMYQKPKTR